MSFTADSHPIGPGDQEASTSARVSARPASQGALAVRLLFGITWAIDAVLKWLPGYRHTFLSQLKEAAQGQPSWLHWWFHGWISVQSHAPSLFADLTGLAETALALVLLLGVARRAGYLFGIVYTLLVWSVGEGFGGPYGSGSTDVGTGIILAILFAALYVTAPSAAHERLSLDRKLVKRWAWWRLLAEPHAADRR
jgi:thiosulfate dehydrogenase [quinone] large subunit